MSLTKSITVPGLMTLYLSHRADAADAAADAGVPASNLADKAPARGKAKSVQFFLSLIISNKLYNRMDSVQRTAADQAAEDAGTPTKLSRCVQPLCHLFI